MTGASRGARHRLDRADDRASLERRAAAPVVRVVLRMPDAEQRAAVLQPGGRSVPRPAALPVRKCRGGATVRALRPDLRSAMTEALGGIVTVGFILAAALFFQRA